MEEIVKKKTRAKKAKVLTKIDIEENISPEIKYDGYVTVKYRDRKTGKLKTIKKHNIGTIGLFTAIALVLSGQVTSASNNIPSSIMGFYKNGDNYENAFIQKISRSSGARILYYDETNHTYKEGSFNRCDTVQYEFLIPATSLSQKTSKISKLVLLNNAPLAKDSEPYTKDSANVCAILTLDDTSAIDTDVSSNILIYWKLRFSNNNK